MLLLTNGVHLSGLWKFSGANAPRARYRFARSAPGVRRHTDAEVALMRGNRPRQLSYGL